MLSFKQFIFRNEDRFEPSTPVKKFWLNTYKSKENFPGVELPGMIQTTNYSQQLMGVVGILILEGIATIISYRFGVSIAAILAAIFIDFFLAGISHWKQSSLILLQNELVIEEKAVERERKKRQISAIKRLKLLWNVCIVISGFFKFYWFYSIYKYYLHPFGLTIDANSALVFTCYIAAAGLHVVYTGYAIYTSRFNYQIQSEYTKYVQSGGQSQKNTEIYKWPINSTIPLEEVRAGNHKIYQDSQNPDKYTFESIGILQDVELRDLISKQRTADQMSVIAREGVRMQLVIIRR
jgi:hypothetical protein